MRVTNGARFVNSFVEDVCLGNLAVSHVCLGDNQIYPEDTSSMRRLTVELPKEGTLEWAYWVHAVAAVQDLVTPKRYMQLTVGGEWYMVRSSFNALPSVMFENNGVFLFYPDEGASLHTVRPGDTVEVKAVIPSIYDTPLSGDGARSYTLPFLAGSGLYLRWYKGQKKKSAGVNFSMTSTSGGTVHIAGNGQKNGHGREICLESVAYTSVSRVVDGWTRQGVNAYRPGDTGVRVTLSSYNSAYGQVARPLWPAFTRTFNLKILSIS